jgi:hypothetical protein
MLHCEMRQVAPGSYSVSVQLEVPQGTSAAAAEQISQQAALIMHKSSSISEVYVQTSRPGVAAESALSSQICDHNDESAEIPAVHVAAPQPSFQVRNHSVMLFQAWPQLFRFERPCEGLLWNST